MASWGTAAGTDQRRDTADTGTVSTAGPRIAALDALRGFALCGILIINIYQQVVFAGAAAGTAGQLPVAVQLLFYERFYPIFSILFGVGFGIFLQRAARRTDHPRAVLARRLLVLLVIGVVHFLFHPGEALTAYAIAGLVFLLPLSFVGGWVALVISVVLLLVGSQIVVGYGPIPGLLSLGYALAVLGVPAAVERRTGRVAVGFVVFGAIAAAYMIAVLSDVALPRINVIGGLGGGVGLVEPLAGIATALAYMCGFLLLLRIPVVGQAISWVLAPMGRMALTNYLAATVMFLTIGPALGIDSADDLPAIVGLTVGILVVQAVWSRLWLATFAYGPMEWLWRCLTWWTIAPLRTS